MARNDIVVLDNLPAYKAPGVQDAIQAAAAMVRICRNTRGTCLSAKSKLRKFSERTIRGLCKRIGSFVPTIGRAECRNYFRHTGHATI